MKAENSLPASFIGKKIKVVIDRPLGSRHPIYNFHYPVNYGYVPGTISGDGEEIDAYVLGVNFPLKEFIGNVIAIIKRRNDNDDKLVIVPDGTRFSEHQIRTMTHFQEQYFDIEIIFADKY